MTEFDSQSMTQAMLDGVGPAVLVFDSDNRLVADNAAARALLGNDLKLIGSGGWAAAAILFDTRRDRSVDVVRREAMASSQPVRFHIYRAGEYVPGWAAAVRDGDGGSYTMITLEVPDWSALGEMLDKFLEETRSAVDATMGHAELIQQTLRRTKPGESAEQLARRVTGFTRLISIHMHRLGLLMSFMERLQDIRTGHLRDKIAERRRRIVLADFVEELMEELDGSGLLDPEADVSDVRGRIRASVPDGLIVDVPPHYLSSILRDMLRNAIMYSMRGAPVMLQARGDERGVQIDVVDEGYGVRASETERVFMAFQRARQPQVIAEFGYGLSLFLCKHEVEAMDGRMWFESEEAVGSTFSIKLPAWRDATQSDDDSSSAASSYKASL